MAFDFNDNKKVLLRAKMFEFMLIQLVEYMKDHDKENSEDFKELRAYVGEEMKKLVTQSEKLTKEEMKKQLENNLNMSRTRLKKIQKQYDDALNAMREYERRLNEET